MRRGCTLIQFSRSLYHYKPRRSGQAVLRQRIKEIASVRVRYGYRRIHVLLRREGWQINHKRVHRLYREEGLSLRFMRRIRRKLHSQREMVRPKVEQVNECWTMDFVSDALFDGRRIRALTLFVVRHVKLTHLSI